MHKTSSSLHFSKPRMGQDKEAEAQWIPNTDVYTTDAGLVIKVELAGMRREDLELTIQGNRIQISGHRPDGCRAGKCKFLVMEINYGPFRSVIELPPGFDLTRATAAYHNGFLRIDVPAAPNATRVITVQSDDENRV